MQKVLGDASSIHQAKMEDHEIKKKTGIKYVNWKSICQIYILFVAHLLFINYNYN
jgi:hypothetical protein